MCSGTGFCGSPSLAAFLLAAFWTTAHQVIIEFGTQVTVLIAGVSLARRGRDWQFRFSVETALLLMVVVSILSTVLRGAGELSWHVWFAAMSEGLTAALVGLTTLWLVFGTTRLRFRVPIGLVALTTCLALQHSFGTARTLLGVVNAGKNWQSSLAQLYDSQRIADWVQSAVPIMLLVSVILLAALLFARFSGWFDDTNGPIDTHRRPRIWPTLVSRVGLVVVLIAVASPLGLLFYRVVTPTRLPTSALDGPNGYDDVIAVGARLGEAFHQHAQTSNRWTAAQFDGELEKIARPIRQLEESLDQPNFQPRTHRRGSENFIALRNAIDCLLLEFHYARRFGTTEEKVDWAIKGLRFCNALSAGSRMDWASNGAFWIINTSLGKLSAQQCRHLATQFADADRSLPTAEEYLLQERIVYEQRGWHSHVSLLLNEWSGRKSLGASEQQYYLRRARLRSLTVQLAVQAYYLENRQLPNSIEQLVPEFLAQVPLNPHTQEPIHFQRTSSSYQLDCSMPENKGKYVVTGPARPPSN